MKCWQEYISGSQWDSQTLVVVTRKNDFCHGMRHFIVTCNAFASLLIPNTRQETRRA